MYGLLRYMMPVSIRQQDVNKQVWYPSRVLDFREGKEIVVGTPLERGREIPFEPGTYVGVQTAHPDGIRRFTTLVLQRRHLPAPCVYLRWPEEIERVQRRQHVRVEVKLPAALHLPSEGKQEACTVAGHTTDLSAGGARLVVSEALTPGRAAYMELHLPDKETTVCEARIVHSGEEQAPRRPKQCWAAVQFTGISASTQTELTKFVFDVQREQIRDGLR